MKLAPHIREACLKERELFVLVRHPDRVKELGEVFTPTELVLEMLEQLPDEMWEDGRTFLDPACGNGQFLAAALIVKRELGHKKLLETVYGVDIMQDNVDECRERLLDIASHTPENQALVERNIVCADGLKYDYSFNGTNKTEEEAQWNNLFGEVE